MTRVFKLSLIWIAATLVAIVMAMNSLPQSLVDGAYIPVGFDAFYHARRILDTINDPSLFYQFDSRIHYPEGSWIAWPWGYDYLVARCVGLITALTGTPATTVLMYVPLAFLATAMVLLTGIAQEIKLSLPFTAIALMGFALSPLTKALYGVGMVDHHSVEQLFVLATLWCGIAWMRKPDNTKLATGTACILGFSVAFHNGLFILQAPIIAAIAWKWLQQRPISKHQAIAFGIALISTTLLAAIPSAPFREGEFSFHLLSWFHVWIAVFTTALAVVLAWIPRNRHGVMLLSATILLGSIPVLRQFLYGLEFISADLSVLQNIDEARGPLTIALTPNGPAGLTQQFGYLIWLVPLWLALCIWQILRDKDAGMICFWITSALCLALLLQQIRFHYYASFALYMVPLVLLQRITNAHPRVLHILWPASAGLLFFAMVPPLKVQLLTRSPVGGAIVYDLNRSLFPALHTACREAPGLVLASWEDGNFVRYHSDCSVLANNFMLTPADTRYAQKTEDLLALSPQALLQQAPEVRYVMIKLTLVFALDELGRANIVWGDQMRKINSGLAQSLLMDETELPKEFRLVQAVSLGPGTPGPISALYEVLPAGLSATRAGN